MRNAVRHALMGARPPFLWTPADFKSVTLVGFYDAENNAKITNAGGFASDWVDSANAANVVTQATGAARPLIVPVHALTGRQVLQFDGTDDTLRKTTCPYPTTGNLSILFVGTQDALAADTTTRHAVATGLSTTSGLMLRRAVTAGVNRFQTSTGNGAGGSNTGVSVGDASGRIYGFGRWASTTQFASLNGVNGVSNTAVMTGAVDRFAIGASAGATAAGFWQGAISAVLYVTGAMSVEDESNFNRWAAGRLGLA